MSAEKTAPETSVIQHEESQIPASSLGLVAPNPEPIEEDRYMKGWKLVLMVLGLWLGIMVMAVDQTM